MTNLIFEYNNVDTDLVETQTANSASSRLRLPHPIPYQGSKRSLAPQILEVLREKNFHRFIEPFAGSAAMTIAAKNIRVANEYVIGDSLAPLIGIWNQILSSPHQLTNSYESLWSRQLEGGPEYYNHIRDEFNRSHDSALLLYLLARCVKNALRFNQSGEFNQSQDKRRLGMHPNKMRKEILGAHTLLAKNTAAINADFEEIINSATKDDIIYMDPPYEGTTKGSNKRYHQGLSRERLISALDNLNRRRIPFILSYDGRSGDKTYGEKLPSTLNLKHLELNAGRSSQSTLSGRNDITIESLYISNSLF